MSVQVEVAGELTSALRAIGLQDASGRIDAGWFEDPLGRLCTVLSNDQQRAALFQFLDEVLTAVPQADGSRWYPLLDKTLPGNVYLTVTDQTIGLAAALATPAEMSPGARGALRMPLVDLSAGTVRPVAGSAEAPIELEVRAQWDAAAHPSSIALVASVDIHGGGYLRVIFEDLDPAQAAGTKTVLDAAHLDAQAVGVLTQLVTDVVAMVPGVDPPITRLVAHLPGILGLDPQLPALPLQDLLRDPMALRTWFAQIAANPASLKLWFTHLAGLLGAGLPAAAPPVSGGGVMGNPWRTPLVNLGSDSHLELTLATRSAASTELVVGLALSLSTAVAKVEGGASLFALPLGGSAPLSLLPEAHLALVTPPAGLLVDQAPALKLGQVAAGLAWDGKRLAPHLALVDVVLNGQAFPTLDLSSLNAIGQAASNVIQGQLDQALGTAGLGHAIQALLGLVPPATDPHSPHTLSLPDFLQNPTRAIAAVHRAALADPAHPWGHLLGELAVLLRLPGTVAGDGSAEQPWRVTIATLGPATLDLAAWKHGTSGVCLGLRIGFDQAPWNCAWRAECFSFDWPADGDAQIAFLGGQHLALAVAPGTLSTATGLGITLPALTASASWAPGTAPGWQVEAKDLVLTGSGDPVGPLTLRLPAPGFDPAAADLGLGLPVDTLTALLRLLLAQALHDAGGPGAFALGGLLGLHRRLEGLPADWPVLEPPELGALLADPLAALQAHLRRMTSGLSADGTPFILSLLPYLGALLRGTMPDRPDLIGAGLLPAGLGTYQRPWVVPLADAKLELLSWMDPAGPPKAWQTAVAQGLLRAASPVALVDLLADLDLPEVMAALDSRYTGDAGLALERLADWLAEGDGLVPRSAQTVAGWATGAGILGAHHDQPADPAAIQQIRDQLQQWGAGAVLLLGPGFSDHRGWDALLQATEPGRPREAHFDLRVPGADPLTLELGLVTAVARHYTADLAEGAPWVEQLGPVVARIQALTGQAKVALVAHSTAGVAARAFAAAQPAAVLGVITLGTPHAPCDLPIDATFAEAVRFAEALQPLGERTAVGRAIGHLHEALDGAAGYSFPGATGRVDQVPGLAIPGWLGQGLLEDLASDLARRASAVADQAAPPTRLGLGLRLRLALPAAAPGGLELAAEVRVDALRLALDAGLAHVPEGRVEIHVDVAREGGGWLIGDAASSPRLRRAELGAILELSDGAGLRVTPRFRLHEVGAKPYLDLAELLADAPASLALSSAKPEPGTPDAFLADLLSALGLLVTDGTGSQALALDELSEVLAHPLERLGQRLPALLDLLAATLGASHPDADTWALPLGGTPLELRISRNPWALAVRTHDPASGAEVLQLAPGLALGLQARTTLPTFSGSGSIWLQLGEGRLAWDGAALTLGDGTTAPPLSLVPAGPGLREELARRLPLLAVSSLASGVLAALAGGQVRVRGLGRLLTDPGGWALSSDGLGTGDRLDGAKLKTLLETLGTALGSPTPGGLALPAGLTLTARATDPVQLALDGSIPLGTGGDRLTLELGLDVGKDLAISPFGQATLTLTLPGSWGQIAITAGADESGMALAVTPTGAPAIQLLPTFSGFGALAAGAVLLLPHVLQKVVDQLAPQPANASGILAAGLAMARSLGVYDFDAQGFEEPTRAAELARMLQPGWLESKVGSGPAITQLIAGLFTGAHPLVPLPGTFSASGSTVEWAYPLPIGGQVTASLGWTGNEPMLLLGVKDLVLGPMVADAVRIGYDQGLCTELDLHLEPGGALGFLRPGLAFSCQAGALGFVLYPLGAEVKDTFAIRVAPEPAFVFQPEAALALVEKWGLPLASMLLIKAFEPELEGPIWSGGPTFRAVLEGAGLVKAASSPMEVQAVLPPIGELGLRALKALLTDLTFELVPGKLWLSLVQEQGRLGIRFKGTQDLGQVSLRFGTADWLEDPAAGVTLWLLEDAPGMPPVRVTPALDVVGLGVVVSGSEGQALLDGSFRIGAAGGFLFFDLAFLDAARELAVSVSRIGAGVLLIDAQIKVSSDSGDGFLQKILPPQLKAPFGLAVAYRDGEGLIIHGGAPGGALELSFPLDLDLVLIKLEELYLALKTQSGKATLEAALSGSASLGPIFAAVQRVGLKATFGGSGPQLGFRAPDGLALSIDAGPVSGGGFLFIDEPKGQYAGALQLNLQTIAITAIGLLNTKMPDGTNIPSPGFSLLLIICVELPPIQLGFGFTLNGIGGLLGFNRTMNLQALRAGVRSRALDTMLFPPDPIANAATVVRTLSAVFPVALDRFVIGPMVRLGWGTPALLTLDICILIEIPSPIRLALLGRIKLALPEDGEAAVVKIHMDIAGTVDFEAGEVTIDACIYDSVIACFALSGDMALRARWKNDPTFTLAIGGFHPAFTPPPDFPTLARVALSLATGDNPRLRLETYLAVTSNTVQFGARFDLHAEAAGFALDGNMAFDALIQFDPFGLMADLGASMSVTFDGETVCSVYLAVHLTGPSPWHVWGKASVSVLFFSATVSFDARFGQDALPPPPPPVRVADLLRAALGEPANWSAQPPEGTAIATLRGRPSGQTLAHPLGGLAFRQRAVPLELTISCYGNAAVEGPDFFKITEVRCGDLVIPAAGREDLRDAFAPAQFQAMSDDEKLSRPSFENFPCGVGLHFDDFTYDAPAAAEAAALDYEVIVLDDAEDGASPAAHRFDPHAAAALASSSAAAAAMRAGPRRFKLEAAQVRLEDRSFSVVRATGGALERTPTHAQAAEAARRLGGSVLGVSAPQEEP